MSPATETVSRPASATASATQAGRRRIAPTPIAYFVRYGTVAVAAAITASAEITAMAQRGMQWRGDLIWTVDWLPVSFILVAPVVAGLSALDTAKSAEGAAHVSRGPVLRTPAFAVVLTYGVVLSAVHLIVLGAALAVSAPPVWDWGAPIAVLCQLMMILLFASLGSAVGRFAKPVTAGAAGALVAFALMYLTSASTDHLSLLAFGGSTVPRIGLAYNSAHLALQAAALAIAIAALLVVRPLEGPRSRQVSPRDATVAGVMVAAVVVMSLTISGDRLRQTPAQPTLCGSVDSVTTCFYPQHERVERAFQDAFYPLVTQAKEKGYGALLPREVREASRSVLPQQADPEIAAFYVMPDHLAGATPTLWEIASGILQPLHCEQVQGENPPSDQYWQDLQLLTATWVGLVDPAAAEQYAPPGATLSAERAAELADQFRTCSYPDF